MIYKEVGTEELKTSLKKIAKIIDLHGDVYLPIFERVQKELLDIHKKDKIKELVIELSRS